MDSYMVNGYMVFQFIHKYSNLSINRFPMFLASGLLVKIPSSWYSKKNIPSGSTCNLGWLPDTSMSIAANYSNVYNFNTYPFCVSWSKYTVHLMVLHLCTLTWNPLYKLAISQSHHSNKTRFCASNCDLCILTIIRVSSIRTHKK